MNTVVELEKEVKVARKMEIWEAQPPVNCQQRYTRIF